MNNSIKHFFIWAVLGIATVAVFLLIQQPWGAILVIVYSLYLVKRIVEFFKTHLSMTERHKRMPQIFWGALVLVILAGAAKFYHYNYVANTPGQARQLKLTGLRDFVCQGELYKPSGPDHCGKRSLWRDSDWGITAYESVYGVETVEEAQAIADFMVDARRRDRQNHIPMELEVFKYPRSQANSYSNTKIFQKKLNEEK